MPGGDLCVIFLLPPGIKGLNRLSVSDWYHNAVRHSSLTDIKTYRVF